MKKSIIIMITLAIIWTSITVKLKTDQKITYNKNEIITASYVTPENLNQLDESSEIILKGSFTGKRKVDKDISVIGPSTISEFKVEKLYKGNVENNIISVLEPFEIIDNNFNSIDGYIPMEKNNEYILFLRENNTSEGKQYTIRSMSFGKYNISKEKQIINSKSNIKYLEEVKDSDFICDSQQLCDIYSDIKNEVLKKYSNN